MAKDCTIFSFSCGEFWLLKNNGWSPSFPLPRVVFGFGIDEPLSTEGNDPRLSLWSSRRLLPVESLRTFALSCLGLWRMGPIGPVTSTKAQPDPPFRCKSGTVTTHSLTHPSTTRDESVVASVPAISLPPATAIFSSATVFVIDLVTKKCVPCNSKDMRPMTEESAAEMMPKVPGWNLVNEDGKLKLNRSWRTKSFTKGLELFQLVGNIAETEGHHPDLHLVGWNDVKIEIWTHAVGENFQFYTYQPSIAILPFLERQNQEHLLS
ncbi:unnamed protein product [Linum tenue]|uniref:4a-hydroxytetrahydrobiopterin dehydratase n=1 Tax=Linum tenue TaxID=586396 RepID=A0AAV0N0X9_9ROSI|nr:unnamed protein product [Linum tenue]